MQGQIAYQRKQTDQALELLAHAADLARKAGGNRILAEIALELARIQRASNKPAEADKTLREGIEIARNMAERLLLPRLLAQLADLRVSEKRYSEAAALLEEATDLLEGLLTNASSPWVRSRVIGGMDDVFLARIRLEGSQGDASRLFSVVEQARGRSLLELLLATPVAECRETCGVPGCRTSYRRTAVETTACKGPRRAAASARPDFCRRGATGSSFDGAVQPHAYSSAKACDVKGSATSASSR